MSERPPAHGLYEAAAEHALGIKLRVAKHILTRITQFRSSESLSSPQYARPEKIRTGVLHFSQRNPLFSRAQSANRQNERVRDGASSGFIAASIGRQEGNLMEPATNRAPEPGFKTLADAHGMGERLLTTKDLAGIYEVTQVTIRNWVAWGVLPPSLPVESNERLLLWNSTNLPSKDAIGRMRPPRGRNSHRKGRDRAVAVRAAA
jgi:hypothetical protein